MDDFELPQSPKPKDKTLNLSFNIRIRKKLLLYILLPIIGIGLLLYALISQGIIGSARVASVAVTVTAADQVAIEQATVEIGGQSGQTDANGAIILSDVPRGTQTLSVTRTGFEPYSQSVNVKRGRNDLGTVTLTETPVEKISVTLSVSDYITETPVTDAKVTLDDIVGIADQANKVYKLNNVPLGTYSLTITKNGYSAFTTKTTVTEDTTALDTVALVQAGTVVFESNRDHGRRGIFTANYDGSNQQPLITRVGDLEDYTPVLGPNQRKLFFTSTRDGLKRENDPNSYKEFMYLSDLDGKNLTKIGETSGGYAVWSPDGGYIGYTRYIDENYSKSEVYTYDVVKKTSYEFAGYNSFSFNFSPDGKQIAFGGKRDGETDYKLFLANSDATNIKEVALSDTNNNFYGMEFTSSGTLRFSRFDSITKKTLWFEYTIASGATTTITAPAIDRESAVLSPDKKLRAYASTRDGKTNIYISDADGKNEKQLTNLNRVVGNLLWSKDGSFIMFDYRAEDESARYLVSINGKAKPKKIVDINLTYYY
jgi:Tol biopolymer transport system component